MHRTNGLKAKIHHTSLLVPHSKSVTSPQHKRQVHNKLAASPSIGVWDRG